MTAQNPHARGARRSPDLMQTPLAQESEPHSRWPLILLLAVILAVYWPVAGFEFSTWDDGLHVTENPHFNPPHVSDIGFFWTHPFQKLYIPLSYTIWMFVAIGRLLTR